MYIIILFVIILQAPLALTDTSRSRSADDKAPDPDEADVSNVGVDGSRSLPLNIWHVAHDPSTWV